MNDYVEVRFDLTPCSDTMTDVMAAMLCDVGYESFVPDEKGLTAYVKAELYDRDMLDSLVAAFPFDTAISLNSEVVEGRDWNAEWEKNYFKPIVIDDRCVIHSTFHHDIPNLDYDIVIDPKMAFGTGHHQTTTLMIRWLLSMPLEGLSLIDVGTGTGILAILAAMRGATPVDAIEIDEFAYVNACENVALNSHPEINVILGDASALDSIAQADVLLANINRNIILADMSRYAAALRHGGLMFLSGFYVDDIDVLVDEASRHGLSLVDHAEFDRWASIKLVKK